MGVIDYDKLKMAYELADTIAKQSKKSNEICIRNYDLYIGVDYVFRVYSEVTNEYTRRISFDELDDLIDHLKSLIKPKLEPKFK